jgi:predicted nucleotidyltransferase
MARAVDLGTEEIIRRLTSDEARKAFEENGVLAAYLYGSAAHGRMHPHSDVDVAVVFEHSVPKSEHFDRRLKLIGAVMDMLHVNDVDVVPLNNAPLLLAFHVLKQPVELYRADERRAAEFEMKTIGMYYDFRPVLDEYGREMFRRIKERGLA